MIGLIIAAFLIFAAGFLVGIWFVTWSDSSRETYPPVPSKQPQPTRAP